MDLRLTGIRVFLPKRATPLFALANLEIPKGQRVLIHGPSGRGKTTLLHLIAGLFTPTEGYVFVGEQNLKFLSDDDRCRLRKKHFGIIFQKLNLLDHLTARENIALGLEGSQAAQVQAADQALEALGMIQKQNEVAKHLSLGEEQRVAVARALAARPQILLADEPTSALDETNANAVMDGLFSLPNHPTIVVVSHDLRIQDRFDRVISFESLIAQ